MVQQGENRNIVLTLWVCSFPGLPLQTLPQQLLLLFQVLFDEAVLAHLLTNLMRCT